MVGVKDRLDKVSLACKAFLFSPEIISVKSNISSCNSQYYSLFSTKDRIQTAAASSFPLISQG